MKLEGLCTTILNGDGHPHSLIEKNKENSERLRDFMEVSDLVRPWY